MKNYLMIEQEQVETKLRNARFWNAKFPQSRKLKRRLNKYQNLYEEINKTEK